MNRNSIMIGSGYFAPKGREQETADFHNIWYENLRKYLGELPQIHLFCNGGSMPPVNTAIGKTFCGGNTGHLGQLLNGTKPYSHCGWSATIMALAWYAYSSEKHLIFLEQDTLVFGADWIERVVSDLGSAGCVFGGPMKTEPYMAAAQALFMVRHSFIPTFCSHYLSFPPDHNLEFLPESKFAKAMEAHPQSYRHLSFGVDREKPIPYDDPIFYAQHLTLEEMSELRRRKLL